MTLGELGQSSALSHLLHFLSFKRILCMDENKFPILASCYTFGLFCGKQLISYSSKWRFSIILPNILLISCLFLDRSCLPHSLRWDTGSVSYCLIDHGPWYVKEGACGSTANAAWNRCKLFDGVLCRPSFLKGLFTKRYCSNSSQIQIFGDKKWYLFP